MEDCASSCGATHASICTLTPTGPAREAHMMQLHAMKHYPLIDQFYFSQQEVSLILRNMLAHFVSESFVLCNFANFAFKRSKFRITSFVSRMKCKFLDSETMFPCLR